MVQISGTPSSDTAVAPSGEQGARGCTPLSGSGGAVGRGVEGVGGAIVVAVGSDSCGVVVDAVLVVAETVVVVSAGPAAARSDDGAVLSGGVVVDWSVAMRPSSPSRSPRAATSPIAAMTTNIAATGVAMRAHLGHPQ
jgi:hypothetical protein